jgi:tetratricopeptide (TPR) repeat protein
MPSHIFARLGLWQEDIQANLKSVALAHPSGQMYMHGHELHAMDFLIYAYLQTGEDQKAKEVLEQAKQIFATPPMGDDGMGMLEYFGVAAARLPATYHLEMHDWQGASQLQPAPNAPPHLQMITYWARTVAYARLGDVENARKNAKLFGEAEDATRKSKYAYVLEGSNSARGETRAWLAFVEKRNDDALREMRAVADRQDKVGKGEVEIPAREMLADMMLELNRPEQALAEYELSMKTDPGRFNGLAGAAHAAALNHQTEKANSYYAQLLKNCDEGKHSERPELRNAKTVIAGGVQ